MTNKNCGVTQATKVLGNKWALRIIHKLCDGPVRFNQLSRDIGEISPKMLSTQLKDLVENNLTIKTIIDDAPPQVQYSLTKKGLALEPIIRELENWGSKYCKEN